MAAICLLAAIFLFLAGILCKALGADSLASLLVVLSFVAVFGAWLGVLLTGTIDKMPGDE